MPRVKGQTESMQGWFRQYFRDHPAALRTRSNEEVIRSWRADHPGREFDRRVQGAMTNAKSNEKKRQGIKKRGPKKKAAEDGAAPKPVKTGVGARSLEGLELAIDRCLASARTLEDQDSEMGDVVKYLHVARNRVVWILGKP